MMIIRRVSIDDAQGIVDIYNYYIKNSEATFEIEPISLSEMKHRIETISAKYPYLVCVDEDDNDRIIGYGYLNQWKSRCAYANSLETTIYMHHIFCGKGYGRKLMGALVDAGTLINAHTLIGVIAYPNPGSERVHEAFGFEKVAHFKEVGRKFGKWIDVVCWQKLLK